MKVDACPPCRQNGAALLAAMLTVTLVASFASAAAWQQWRAVEIETAERARVQASWILVGALDWSRLILREDGRSGGADHLAEPWAVPLQEARLSSFLAADKNNVALSPGEDLDVFLSGQIMDLQSRMNVTNLVDAGRISEPALRSFSKLFELLDLEQSELLGLAENMRFASDQSPDNRSGQLAPLMPQRIEQLVWLGLSANTLQKLKPFITVLPSRTPVNVNTAPAEVLYATVPSLELEGARRLETERARQHFRNLAEAGQLVPEIAGELSAGNHSIATRFFEVSGRLRLADTVVQERSVLQRDGLDVKTLWRERATVPKLDAIGFGASGSLQ
jgi:general secretion pathway protein K